MLLNSCTHWTMRNPTWSIALQGNGTLRSEKPINIQKGEFKSFTRETSLISKWATFGEFPKLSFKLPRGVEFNGPCFCLIYLDFINWWLMESISLELNSSVSNSVQSTGERTVSNQSAEQPLDLSMKTSSHEIAAQQLTVPVHHYYLPPLQSLLSPTFIKLVFESGLHTAHTFINRTPIAKWVDHSRQCANWGAIVVIAQKWQWRR